MSDSTKRAIRTALQVLIALLTAIPTIASSAPNVVVIVQVVAVAAALSKIINSLEDSGLLPSWLTNLPVVGALFKTKPVAAA